MTRGMSFLGLIAHNVSVKKLRLTFSSLAVAIGVLAVVTFSVITHSLRNSELAVLKTGSADFTIAQKGVSDILSSNIDQNTVSQVRGLQGVAKATGVLIQTVKLNSDNPQFIEIGIEPKQLQDFGVTIVQGAAFAAQAPDQIMLGYRAAANLDKKVGDSIVVDTKTYRVVGLYSAGQALADAGAMFPLVTLQANTRASGEVTLVFVQVYQGVNIPALRAKIEQQYPQLVTIRTVSDFGRADRSLALINAGENGTTILAIVVGAIIVMTTMTITFMERTREFGLLSAVGWSGGRIMLMVLSEALIIGMIGALGGIALSFAATQLIGQLPSLVGILSPVYTASAFWRGLYTAAAMSVIGGIYPAARAARLSPVEALRRE